MKKWKITLYVEDSAQNEDTGETFRHMGRHQIIDVVTSVDIPAAISIVKSESKQMDRLPK